MKIIVEKQDSKSTEPLNNVKSVHQKKNKFEIERFDGEVKIYNNDDYQIRYLTDN